MAADGIGISVDSLQRYLREERCPSLEVAANLARVSGVPIDWLIAGDSTRGGAAGTDQERVHQLPLFSTYTELTQPAKDHAERRRYLVAGVAVGPTAFAWTIGDDAMSPLMQRGSVVVVDPTRSQADESFALVAFPQWEKAVVRRVVLDLGTVRLEPVRKGYSVRELTDVEHRLIGVVVRVDTIVCPIPSNDGALE